MRPRLCIYHPRLADGLAEGLRRRGVPADVVPVADVRNDPPDAASFDAIVAFRLPPGLLGRMPRLRWLQLTTSGATDHLAGAGLRPEITVTRGPTGATSAAVAEWVLAGLLGLARDLRGLDAAQRRGAWIVPDARLLAGGTLVAAGLGKIGGRVAAVAKALGMRVVGVTRRGEPHPAADQVVPLAGLVEACRGATALAVTLPAHETTRGAISATVLDALAPGALLVSASHAGVVVEDDVVAALGRGQLAGAALDCFTTEPLPATSPLWATPGLLVSSHTSAYSRQALDEFVALIAGNLERFARGAPLEGVVTV